jgi:type VI secretion system protein ImpG
MTFSRFYQSELLYLRELGREFAATNPALAGLFAERGADPDVDRLLECFAFLTARIRERLDDAVPEVIEQLCQLSLPQYMRSVPAVSVVEFSPPIRALKGVQRIPMHSELGTRAIQDTVCSFRTTRELALLPVAVANCQLDPSIETSPRIRLSLTTTEIGAMVLPQHGSLRIFLHGGLGQTSLLYLWLARHLTKVTCVAGDQTVDLGRDCVRLTSIGEGGSVFPWPEFAPEDMKLVLEYYTQPSLMLFVDVVGLEKLTGKIGTSFDLVFQFERPPKLPERLEKEAMRLHCVPVVNLFETTSEPIRRDLGGNEYLLRAAGLSPRHADVFEVLKVTGIRPKAAPLEYPPYHHFATSASPVSRPYHWVRRAISPIDEGLDTYLAVGQPRDQSPLFPEETLSVELVCTNRMLPTELRVGDISTPTARSPTAAPFKNIVPVSRPVRPAIGTELAWRFISHVAVNQRSLSDPQALRAMLGLYNFAEGIDVQLARANRLRVEAIRSVNMTAAKRLLDHIPTRGVRTSLEIDETAFATLGDLHLFGCTLDAFFASQAPVNTFHELVVVAHPSGATLAWTPRSGIEPVY